LALKLVAFMMSREIAKPPQGLNPSFFLALFGTTKVVPCYKTGVKLSFFAVLKAVPNYKSDGCIQFQIPGGCGALGTRD
jgi:hypothetical protein